MSEGMNHSNVREVGPMMIVEDGIIFKQPFKSHPLKGFDNENSFNNSEKFLNRIKTDAVKWFERFPDCCDTHREIAKFGNFNKTHYNYIPDQILNNVKYFAHALETFIDDDNGMDEIKDYLDYLIESLGRPGLGLHVFKGHIKHFIENGYMDSVDQQFTDDQRLELLEHLEPKKPPVDIKDREFETLYIVFQKWLENMPNIGRFKNIKARYTDKLPMNLFAMKPKYNKYIGMASFITKSKSELIVNLTEMTNDILILSKNEISPENYDKNKLLLAADERLRLKQTKLLEYNETDHELRYITLIENWLNIMMEYYHVLNDVIKDDKLDQLNTNVNTVILTIDELKTEVISLYKSNKVSEWVKKYLSESSYDKLITDIDQINEEESEEILNSISKQLSSNTEKETELEVKVNSSEISVKHKIKISIPLFLFTKYETELELSDKQKLPTSTKELKKYLGFGK